MKHRPWQELFERLPPKTQVAVKENTAQVLTELGRAERNQHDEGRREDAPVPARQSGLPR